ncbi:MAG: PDZ domain-containing protein, partial [Bacteroidetes bacterium]|nr:PDZ domain-containing protein [Bacteroidota bacterium]
FLTPILNQLGLELKANAGTPSEKILGIKSIISNGNYLISSLHPEGTALKNDLRVGDEIYAINGMKIKGDIDKWMKYFGNNKIKLSIQRNGTLLDIEISEFSSIGFEQLSLSRNTQISEEQSDLFSSWIGTPKENLPF